MLRLQLFPLLREIVQQHDAISDQVRGGFMARIQDENTVLDQLHLAQPTVRSLPPDQPGQHVGFRIAGLRATACNQVLQIGRKRQNRIISTRQGFL